MTDKEKPVIHKWVSFYELEKVGAVLEVYADTDENTVTHDLRKLTYKGREFLNHEVDTVLWNLGLNTKEYKYSIEPPVQHRVSNEIVYTYRFLAPERLDKEWIEKGKPSEEAKLASSKMNDMLKVAYALSHGNMKNY